MGQKQPKLKQDAVEELLNQTSFTEAEIQDWYKGFLKECPTGHLSIDDFKRVYTKFFPYGESSRFAEYVFRTFDRNRDGLIDFRDFLSSLNVTNRGDLSQKLRWAFTMYDLDNDGYISRQDLVEVLTHIIPCTWDNLSILIRICLLTEQKRTEKIFQLMDSDRDNRLSLDEFIDGVKCDKLLMRLLTFNTHPLHRQHSNNLVNGLNGNKGLSYKNTRHHCHQSDNCTEKPIMNQSLSKQNIIHDTSES
ncbi:Neurocalcin like [Schistosoma japonicum]|nr:Neurocalcin like [Schistosoma japonicum]KAH8874172.1 Neurocalcin like [Schistosoma japonicum]